MEKIVKNSNFYQKIFNWKKLLKIHICIKKKFNGKELKCLPNKMEIFANNSIFSIKMKPFHQN